MKSSSPRPCFVSRGAHGLLVVISAAVTLVVGLAPGIKAAEGNAPQNGRRIVETAVGISQSASVEGAYGSLSGSVEAGANGSIQVDANGVALQGQVGLAAELEAVSKQFKAGNEDLGASVQGSAKLEALLGAEGKVGAYIDEKGITIGAEARAGAFVSAEAQLNFEAHVFGLQANVKVYAEAHAGALARGEALVMIGFDGRIRFRLGAGISVGVGASAGVEFDLDASEFMRRVGIKNLSELVAWLAKFSQDPGATLEELVAEAKQALVNEAPQRLTDAVHHLVKHWVLPHLDQLAERSETSASTGVGSTGEDLLPLPTQPPDTGGELVEDTSRRAASERPYSRYSQYKEWSK